MSEELGQGNRSPERYVALLNLTKCYVLTYIGINGKQ